MFIAKIRFLQPNTRGGLKTFKTGVIAANSRDITHTTCEAARAENEIMVGFCSSWPLDRQFPIIPARGLDCQVGMGSLFATLQ